MGSPFTSANGISTCSCDSRCFSGAAASDPTLSELSTTTRSSGFAAFFTMAGLLVHAQVHDAPHFIEGRARGFARLLATLRHDITHQLGILLELLRALADSGDLLDHLVDERLLAFQAADAGRAAAVRGPLSSLLVGIDLVQVEHRAYIRIAR